MADVATSWTATQIVSLVATSSVLSAGMTVGAAWLRERLGERREGKFAALTIALALERYAEACSDALYDSHNFVSSSGSFGRDLASVDDLPEYPSVNWKALGIDDTEAAMSFRTDVDFEQGRLASMREFVDDDEVLEQARVSVAEVGSAAANLAKRLRSTRGLRPLARDGREVHLRDSKVEYAELRAKVAAARAAHRMKNPQGLPE